MKSVWNSDIENIQQPVKFIFCFFYLEKYIVMLFNRIKLERNKYIFIFPLPKITM